MSARVLVLTAGYGEGHNAAARALAAACDAAQGPGTAHTADVFAAASPRLNALTRRAYLECISRAPHAWSAFYGWLDRSDFLPNTLWMLRGEARVLRQLIEREKPAIICSTYPVYAFLLEKLARQGLALPPRYNVVTDSISINSLWWRAPCDGWFLPNEDSVDIVRRGGIPSERLHVSGFPVAPFFSANAQVLAPTDLTTGAKPRVLYIINSGTRAAADIARRLITDTNWELTCAVGRNGRLRRELTKLAAGRATPANILGWTNRIPHLLMTHHVVISKAGGATTQEALAARCPMIVNQIVPGQEEGNYELLRRHGVGALSETPEAVLATLDRAFADRGRVWQEWRTALAPLVRPDAARDIAAHLLAHAARGEKPAPVSLRPVGPPHEFTQEATA
jgi:processive 1,2-diacylglycerol beta-glucosyltransferase